MSMATPCCSRSSHDKKPVFLILPVKLVLAGSAACGVCKGLIIRCAVVAETGASAVWRGLCFTQQSWEARGVTQATERCFGDRSRQVPVGFQPPFLPK